LQPVLAAIGELPTANSRHGSEKRFGFFSGYNWLMPFTLFANRSRGNPGRILLDFALLLMLLSSSAARAQSPAVAMTVDDLPYVGGVKPLSTDDAKHAVLENGKILTAFSRHHIPVTGFVVEQYAEQIGIDTGKEILQNWVDQGFDLGNHTYSHPDVNGLSVDQIETEILRGETTIRPLLQAVSRRPQFFRFPYNHTGDTVEKHDAIAAFLREHGYRLAPCTIDNSDYVFNRAYVLALARKDKQTAAKLRAEYVSYSAVEIDWYTKLDMQVFGHEVPHVMLLHDNQLNADMIEAILALFEQRGYRFVSLSEAEQDPAYAAPETFITKFGPMWGYRWAKELNVKVDGKDEPDPPAWINQYSNAREGGKN
jgi:peptidoglycan/xylan/chitin deacetylase (PgdA/CDA1 family)